MLRVLMLCVLAWPCMVAGGQVIYVDASASPGGSGRSWEQAFDSLHAGLAAAGSGDQVWVAGGVYPTTSDPLDRDATFTVPDGVRVYGGFVGKESKLAERGDPFDRRAILDGLGVSYTVVTMDDTGPGTTLDGFTILDGVADGGVAEQTRGGGIHARGATGATPNLRNLDIRDCFANLAGSAIYVGSMTATPITIERVLVTDNTGDQSAVYVADGSSQLTDVDILGNDVTGLAILSDGFHRIVDCRIEGNTSPAVSLSFGVADVGGIYIDMQPGGIGTEIEGSVIRGNSGPRSGGVSYRGVGQHVLRLSRILDNEGTTAVSGGGGIAVISSTTQLTLDIENCLIAGNEIGGAQGSGVLAQGSPVTVNIFSSTVADNASAGLTGSAVEYGNNGAGGQVINTIIWGNTNTGGLPRLSDSLDGTNPGPTADRCILEHFPSNPISVPFSATDCSGDDPLFADTAVFDLSASSPAIDAGDNASLPGLVAADILGRVRIRDDAGVPDSGKGLPGEPIIDLGAAEFQGTTPGGACSADVNGDGVVSDSDFFAWVTAFIADPRTTEQEAACDVNENGSCSDSDFFAWVTLFVAGGCP